MAVAVLSATSDSPFVGPRPFRVEDEVLFFGRESEVEQLYSYLSTNGATLLYAQSGVGKTSLINAGLLPQMQAAGTQFLGPARVQGIVPEKVSPELIDNIYRFHVLLSCEQARIDQAEQYVKRAEEEQPQRKNKKVPNQKQTQPALDLRQAREQLTRAEKSRISELELAQMPLKTYLQRVRTRAAQEISAEELTASRTAKGFYVLILDQFEELFTFYPECWTQREAFFQEVYDAMEGCPSTLRITDIKQPKQIYNALQDSQNALIRALREEQEDVAAERVKSKGSTEAEAAIQAQNPALSTEPVTLAAYLNDVIQSADFYARWYAPDDQLKPHLDQLLNDNPLQSDAESNLLTASSTDFTRTNRSLIERIFPDCLKPHSDGDPLLRLLFAMREDYIGEIEPFFPLAFNQTDTRFRLASKRFRLEKLRPPAALQAIVEPVEQAGKSFSVDADSHSIAADLITELRRKRIIAASRNNQPVYIDGEFIEPIHLQLICDRIWKKLRLDETEITREHLKTSGNLDAALREFYEEALHDTLSKVKQAADDQSSSFASRIAGWWTGAAKDLEAAVQVDEGALRRWFQHSLIDDYGNRKKVYRGETMTDGLPNPLIEVLVASYILRREWIAGANVYELAQDRLIEPIRTSNKAYVADKDAEAHSVYEDKAAKWKAKQGKLLTKQEIKEFDEFQTHPGASFLGISSTLRDYVSASKNEAEIAQLRREKRAQKQKVRVFGSLSAIAFVALLFAVTQFFRAKSEAKNATEQSRIAKQQAVKAQEAATAAEVARTEERNQRQKADRLYVIAINKAKEAEKQKENAGIAEKKARDQKAKAEEQAQRAVIEAANARRAEIAAKQANREEINQRRIAEKNEGDAQKFARLAEKRRLEADKQRGIAETKAKEATEQGKKAKESEAKAVVSAIEAKLAEEEAKKQEIIAKAETAKAKVAFEAAARAQKGEEKQRKEAQKSAALAEQQRQRAMKNAQLATRALMSPDNQVEFYEYATQRAALTLNDTVLPSNSLLSVVPIDKQEEFEGQATALHHLIEQNSPNLLIFSPSGERVLTSSGKELSLWKTKDNDAADRKGSENSLSKQADSPAQSKQQRLADSNQYLYRWTKMPQYKDKHSIPVRAAAFSPDSQWFVSAGKHDLTVTNSLTGQRIRKVERKEDAAIYYIAISTKLPFDKGKQFGRGYIATAADNGEIKVWDIESCKGVPINRNFPAGVTSITFNSEQNMIFCTTGDGQILRWNVARAGGIPQLSNPTEFIRQQQVTGNQPLSDNMAILLCGGQAPGITQTLPAHDGPVTSLCFNADGTRLISTGFDGVARIWDAASGHCLNEFEHKGEAIKYAALTKSSAGGLITLTYDNTMRLWSAIPGTKIVSEPLAEQSLDKSLDFLRKISGTQNP